MRRVRPSVGGVCVGGRILGVGRGVGWFVRVQPFHHLQPGWQSSSASPRFSCIFQDPLHAPRKPYPVPWCVRCSSITPGIFGSQSEALPTGVTAQHGATPIYLFATAGMRELPADMQETIVTAVNVALAASPFLYDPSRIEVMLGVHEVSTDGVSFSPGLRTPFPPEQR